MNYARIGLDDLTLPAQIQYGRRLIAGFTGNPNFPTPNPTVAALTAATDALEAAYNDARAARLTAKTKTQLQDEKMAAFGETVSLLASYVDNASGGDATVIESSGFLPSGPLRLRSARSQRRQMCRRPRAHIPAMPNCAGAVSMAPRRTTSNARKAARNWSGNTWPPPQNAKPR
jgi:hypothetical protein